MNRNSIRWRLPASYAVIALLAALSLGSLMLLVLRSHYADQEHRFLLGNALALQPVLEQVLQSNPTEDLVRDQITGLAFLSQSQIRLLDPDGNTIADSGAPNKEQFVAVSGAGKRWFPASGSGPAEPPEARMATVIYVNDDESAPGIFPFQKDIPYSGPAPKEDIVLSISASPYGYGFVQQADFDPTRRSSQAVSIPLTASNGQPLGMLEFSNGPSYGADIIASVTGAWFVASIFAIAIAALTGWFISQRVTHPVLVLEKATRQMEQGDLSVRIDLQNEKQEEFLSLADSFNGMVEQVEQTVSTLRAFVADAAHELHTPLTALQANLELAREDTLVPHASENASARTRYLSRAQEQAQRLEVLVKSLLNLSRVEAGESRSNFAPVDIILLVREVGEQYASRAEQTDRLFTMNLPDGIAVMLGNETQLRQVVINLLENALKFTPASGSISLSLERSANQITLTISDSGIGIPPEDMPHIFERFHRGRNVSEFSGNGLGLAIVKAIANVHKGRVAVQSKPLQGTSISVFFPFPEDGSE